MNKYTDFECDGVFYSLTHLQPMDVVFIQGANEGKPEKQYRCVIEFGHHCFTKSPNYYRGEQLTNYPSKLYYQADGETRLFCFERYEMSKRLPEFLKNMDKEKCFFTAASDKFVTIRIQNEQGVSVDYEIYFSLKKSRLKHVDVYIFINSAYIRSADYKPVSKSRNVRRKPVSLFVLLHNYDKQ